MVQKELEYLHSICDYDRSIGVGDGTNNESLNESTVGDVGNELGNYRRYLNFLRF